MAKENDEAIYNALLIPERSSSTPTNDNHDPGSHPDERQKTKSVINMLGIIPELLLPDDWIAVYHESGGIVYLHKKSRVKHKVPVVAIPCMHQILGLQTKTAKRKRSSSSENLPEKRSKVDNTDEERCVVGEDGIETEENTKLPTESVDRSATVDYISPVCCQQQKESIGSLCEDSCTGRKEESNEDAGSFKGVCGGVKNGAEARLLSELSEGKHSQGELEPGKLRHNKEYFESQEPIIATKMIDNIEVIDLEDMQMYLGRVFDFKKITEDEARMTVFGEGYQIEAKPELPSVLKAVPFATVYRTKNKFAVTPGKTPLAILTEFCSKELKKPLDMVDVKGKGDQYVVEVVIDGLKYGQGEGRSKKVARQVAAEKTMEILLPKQFEEMKNFEFTEKEFSVFDGLDIEDPSVADCARSVGLPAPAEVLSTCLKRNRGLCDADIEFKLIEGAGNDPHTYEITCGKHTATGKCKNRKTGKHLAAQAILKKIHPKLEKWGQLVRMYCNASTKFIRDSKKLKSDKEFSELPRANPDLMLKLKREMRLLEKSRHESVETSTSQLPSTSSIPSGDLDLG
eukprot:gene15874-7205_t